MNIVPDEYLERQTCDDCHKFLTVHPVKIYPNGERKCGRCSKPDDDGNIIRPVIGTFKCINRFDGCRELLTIDDVVAHEKYCISLAYPCPLCKSSKTVPTFMMMKHFREHHECNLLKYNTINVNMAQPNRTFFLHKEEDNLFFIECLNMTTKNLELTTFFLGKKANMVMCRFIVYFGGVSSKMEIIKKQCTGYGKPNTTSCEVRAPSGTPRFTSVRIQINVRFIERYFNILFPKMSQTEVSLPRTICLIDDNTSRISVGSDRTSLILEDSQTHTKKSPTKLNSTKYILFCLTCLTTAIVDEAFFIETSPMTFHVLCEGCSLYYMYIKNDYVLTSRKNVSDQLVTANFAYSCVWKERGCNEYFVEGVLEEHEIICPHQLPQRCPSMECVFVGTLSEMEIHFKTGHLMGRHFILERYVERLLVRQYPIIIEDREDYGICHMWCYYGFISIKVAPIGRYFFTISFVHRKIQWWSPEETEPELIILNTNKYTLKILTTGKSIMVRAGTPIRIWSFFRRV